jgi:hypothetical protein
MASFCDAGSLASHSARTSRDRRSNSDSTLAAPPPVLLPKPDPQSFLEDGDEVVTLQQCRHAFHARCIQHWFLTERYDCPVCRSVFWEKKPASRSPVRPMRRPGSPERKDRKRGLSWWEGLPV